MAERVDALNAIIAEYQKRMGDLAAAVTEEMGAPDALAAGAQVPIGLAHLMTAAAQLPGFSFAEDRGTSRVVKEPIGVRFHHPVNWPLNQLTCKIAPALATGCMIVVKPSEVALFSAAILAEIIDTAGFRQVCSIWSTATAPVWAQHCPATRTSTWCRSREAPVRASRWPGSRAHGQAGRAGTRRQESQRDSR